MAMPGVSRAIIGSLCRVGIKIAAGGRAHLDRHFARHFVLPAARGIADQHGRAGGERGEKGHDGNDGHQRPPGDRSCGHQRHVFAAAAETAFAKRRVLRDRAPPLPSPPYRVEKCSSRASIVNMQAAVAKDEPPGAVELIHQSKIMGRDHNGGSRFVQFGEKPQEPARQLGSTLPVGSSASSSSGRTIRARAIAARCFSPPDRTGGRMCMRSPSPTHCKSSTHFGAVMLPPYHARAKAARRSHRSSNDRAAGNPERQRRFAAADR